MYVRMNVCMYVRMYEYAYTCINVCMYARMYDCMYDVYLSEATVYVSYLERYY